MQSISFSTRDPLTNTGFSLCVTPGKFLVSQMKSLQSTPSFTMSLAGQTVTFLCAHIWKNLGSSGHIDVKYTSHALELLPLMLTL